MTMADTGFLIVEDEALKNFLKTMTITVGDTQNATRPLQVRFSNPDLTAGSVQYPIMLLDLVDIRHAPERQHSGLAPVPFTPTGLSPALGPTESLVSEMPIPVDLVYQAVAYSRNPYHNREIQRQMLLRWPFNMGAIAGLEVPEDNTVRRAYMTRASQRTAVDSNTKRVYITTYDITVESEMYPWQIHRVRTVQTATVTTNVFVNTDVVSP